MDSIELAARRRLEIAALPAAPLGGHHRAAVLDDGTPGTHVVLWALRTRGWRTTTLAAHPRSVMDLMADPPALVVVADRHLSAADSVSRLLGALRTAPDAPLVVALSTQLSSVPASTRPGRRRWLRLFVLGTAPGRP